jgi:hypothetical protein
LYNEEKFKVLNEWFDNFKKRYNLKQYNIHREGSNALIQNFDLMKEKLYQTLRNYNPKDIFNCNETSLFWKIKLSHTISNGPVIETKQSKDCVTILFTCNSINCASYLYINMKILECSKISTKIPFQSNIIGIKKVEYRYLSGMIILKN